jgi:hypothetical protein
MHATLDLSPQNGQKLEKKSLKVVFVCAGLELKGTRF